MDVLLGSVYSNLIERELANMINGSIAHNDLDSRIRTNPSDENEIRYSSHEGQFHRRDRFLDSMQTFSNEINN